MAAVHTRNAGQQHLPTHIIAVHSAHAGKVENVAVYRKKIDSGYYAAERFWDTDKQLKINSKINQEPP